MSIGQSIVIMEKTINQYIEIYFSKFKNDVQLKSINLDFSEKDKINDLSRIANIKNKYAFRRSRRS